MTLIAIMMSAILACSAAAQTVSSATFFIGGGDVPAGADPSRTTVDIIDSDPLVDDVLARSILGFLEPDAFGNLTTKDVNTVLFCQDGEVRGPAGGSGENPANIYVRVVFRNSANQVLGVIETGTKNVKCL